MHGVSCEPYSTILLEIIKIPRAFTSGFINYKFIMILYKLFFIYHFCTLADA